jgi:hypothetical protein
MNVNEGYWGGGISIISQNFSKSPLGLVRFSMFGLSPVLIPGQE